ncbi:putative bifunctional diguanylate cyclase/phosphodiesterase [Oceanimonas marisflavi]|uniref:putative bifunctional diguanylate cyclase/phosphodiesterase n=1 Tax=Oceanimonas marisflavi TaxID=2059724 RepID=UPI000D30B586|nr:EAL domain-containing protein [Oceanimonas marisflavi]
MIFPHSSRILVVDDKQENLYAMETLLQECGAEVLLASSGNEALSLTLHHDFALILMDVQMPEMDGFETASLIHQDEEVRKTPIIFLTALNRDVRYISQGYQSGAVDYLIKPVDSDMLLSKVRIFLALDRYRHELTAMKRQYQLLLNCAGEGILGVSPSGHVQFANEAAAQILGYPDSQLRDRHLHQLLYRPEDEIPSWEHSPLYMAYQGDQPYRVYDGLLWRQDGVPVPAEYTSAPLKDESGRFLGGVIVFQDISLRKQTEQRLLELAQYDPLTGLANRTLFQEFLSLSLSRARRRKGNMAVLLLDLDHFKDINDTLGHDTGDRLLKSVAQRIQYSVQPVRDGETEQEARLLKSVAQRLQHNLRRSDLVARLGGDEFAIILDEISQPEDAAVVAQKVLRSLAAPHQLEQYQVYVSPSIGIATYPACSAESETLLKAADTALYQAKAMGRNNYQFYAPDMHRTAMERMRLEQDLRYAVNERQLSLHYQPQIHLASGELLGIEVLLRWQHPELGMIPPARFIPMAERIGIMAGLGEWILDQACGQFRDWCRAGLLDEPVTLALNISTRQLTRSQVLSDIQTVLERHGLPARRLSLELTENALRDEQESVLRGLEQLRQLGCRIALDDFGTGYSSFNQIHCLPIDTLKLAQPFVGRIGQDAKNDAVIKTIIGMAHTLDFELIAEGVETREQADFLRANGCHRAQGFFIQPPLSSTMMTRLLQNRLPSGNGGQGTPPADGAASYDSTV